MTQTQRIHPFSQLMILIGLFGAGLILASIATIVILKTMLGISLFDMPKAITDPSNVEEMRLIQVVSTFFTMCLPALIFARIISRHPFSNLGFNNGFNLKQLFFILLLMLASMFVVGALGELNQLIPISKSLAASFKKMEDEYNKQVMALAHMNTTVDFLYSLLILCLLPAIFEEMFFRGAMQPVFIKWTKHVFPGILLTSIIFSLVHASYYGFLPRLFLGLLLGYIYWYGKSIWLNIILHFLNNAFAVTEMFVLNREGKLTAESMNDTFPIYYGLLGLIAVLALFVVYKKESERLFAERAVRLEQNVLNSYGDE